MARTKTSGKIERLKAVLVDKHRMLIVLQDHPDPDALASATALRELVRELAEIPCSMTHRGTVGRAENRALVQYLDLNLHQCDRIEFDKFDLVGMVDTQPGTGNNCLPPEVTPHIVIDHHPCKRLTRSADFHDIRSRCGATSTILLEYLRSAGITPDVRLATALLYGIRSDTQDLGREATRADIEATGSLFPLANPRMLSDIQRGLVPRSYYRVLVQGLLNARVYRDATISGFADIDNADMIGEVADLLLRDEGISTVMCYGFCQGRLVISIRLSDSGRKAGTIAKHVVSRRGTGGGHDTYAGGQIILKENTPLERTILEEVVRRRFLKALGLQAHLGVNLLRF
ncbi:MAG: DHH family phosphoesterase [Phycisphaerales bacterium]|nr:MAG: DHH family phosphoesterase [Phycisphaerales bacterium]